MTRGEANARRIVDFLNAESFLARYESVSSGKSEGDVCYEIRVPGSEAREAQQLLIENNLLLR